MSWLINCLIGLFSQKINRRPEETMAQSLFKKILWVCDNRPKKHPEIEFCFEEITEEMLIQALMPVLQYIDNKHDCADFRCLSLIKFKKIANDLLMKYPNVDENIKKTLLGFKFWLLQDGKDAVCYYSENHQIVFITCEYLIGRLYPDELFTIDRKNGTEHQRMAKERFNWWMELRNAYSYSEFYSSNYFPIDLTALAMIIQYSNDEVMIEKSKEQMDLLLKFYASTLFENTFINASGRDYGRNVMNCSYKEPNSAVIIDAVFNGGQFAIAQYQNTAYLFASFYLKGNCYHLNKNIRKLADKEEMECKRKFSLNLCDYQKEGMLNNETKSIMMRLGSGALTNPEIIDLTIDMMNKHPDLYASDFLHWLRYFISPVLYWLRLMPWASRTLDFYNNRMAIEANNVYTYRNAYYRLSCSQGYQPGTIGAQRNTVVATLPKGITVYITHPLVKQDRKNYNQDGTPSYFGGYGVAPDARADHQTALILYDIKKRKPFLMPYPILNFTHAYFPTELFDDYEVDGRYAFVRVKDSYIALIGKNQLKAERMSPAIFKTMQGKLKDINKSCDLIQQGRQTYWIIELSCLEKENYEQFKERIKNNRVIFDNNQLSYHSLHHYQLEYKKEFIIDGKEINTDYRYDVGGPYEES